jgi:hypothetical protein
MANQTISGLSTISSPSSAALAWIYDPNASPQDRSLSLANLLTYLISKGIQRKVVSTSGTIGTLTNVSDTDFILTAASTATLPASPDHAGLRFTFKAKTAATSTISANSGQTIGTTSSTSFVLYAQEDYVTLEWDGTSIWYVVATNGPVQSSNQTATGTFASTGSWLAIGNGLTLGTLAPGVYDIFMECSPLTNASIQNISVALGKETTPISAIEGVYNPSSGTEATAHVEVRGYVLTASATIQGIGITSNTGCTIYYNATYGIGKIVVRRIG